MIKFQHSLFALPWAGVGALYAAGGLPTGRQVLWILVAMVSARSAAMAFNRIADAKFDRENPRTKDRILPSGTWAFTIAMIALFILSAAMLNRLCLTLTPVALLVVLGYSYTKRFTALCHFVLGLSLGMAPIGAWLGIRPEWNPLPFLLGGAVLFWIAGADIVYACEDVEFDRRVGLRSVPAALGVRGALRISLFCHILTLGALIAVGLVAHLGILFYAGLGAIALLLLYEHAIVKPDDLRRVNTAFFHLNAAISIAVFVICVADLMARSR